MPTRGESALRQGIIPPLFDSVMPSALNSSNAQQNQRVPALEAKRPSRVTPLIPSARA